MSPFRRAPATFSISVVLLLSIGFGFFVLFILFIIRLFLFKQVVQMDNGINKSKHKAITMQCKNQTKTKLFICIFFCFCCFEVFPFADFCLASYFFSFVFFFLFFILIYFAVLFIFTVSFCRLAMRSLEMAGQLLTLAFIIIDLLFVCS